MDKIKKWYQSIPLWLAVFLFMALALIISSFVSNRVTFAAYSKMAQIQSKYMTLSVAPDGNMTDGNVTYHMVTPADAEEVIWNPHFDEYSTEDMRQYQTATYMLQYAPFFIYSIGILIAGLLFYLTKLKRPMTILQNASARIAENELGFPLDYSGHDEMAKLCAAFDKMRAALDENNQRMLHMIDERQQLNDAYTHDLRTPIAVLKGYTDMLIKYLPTGQLPQEEVLETVTTMSNHVARLEQFVDSMNTAQKLADITIQREPVPTDEFVCQLRESAAILCESHNLRCEVNSEIKADKLKLDPAVVTQVYENLLSNAIRFAGSTVTIHIGSKSDVFSITVIDDGHGFTEKELLKAAQPYYSGQQEKDKFHFGLGLHICRTLCEKHGGRLQLSNSPGGGAVVTAEFAI